MSVWHNTPDGKIHRGSEADCYDCISERTRNAREAQERETRKALVLQIVKDMTSQEIAAATDVRVALVEQWLTGRISPQSMRRLRRFVGGEDT